jgi:ketosteroid isomerase-like protein
VPRYWTEFAAHWQTVRIEPHEFIEAREHVVVAWSLRGVGRDGIEVETDVTWTWTLTDGRVKRVAYFPTREEALKAAGLSE